MTLALVVIVALSVPLGARTGAHIEIELLEARMPVALSVLGVGLVGTAVANANKSVGVGMDTDQARARGWNVALSNLAGETFAAASNHNLLVIATCVLMGTLAGVSGMSNDLFAAACRWMGHRRGGLASATIAARAGFAALSGSSLASAVTMGRVALPEMKRYNYAGSLATATVFLIIIGAFVFIPFMSLTELPGHIVTGLTSLPIGDGGILLVIILAYMFLGMFLESMAMLVLTIPVVIPIAIGLDWDLIWVGIIVVIVLEMGMTSPPFGINVFIVKSIVPEVPMRTIFRGIWPFRFAMALMVGLLALFPHLALFLPHTVVGQHINEICARNRTPCTLEPGGRSPTVILADADLGKVVPQAARSIFLFAGQACIGSSRFYVARSLYDDFVARFAMVAGKVGMGDLRDPATVIAPIIAERQRARVRDHIADAVARGATVVTGGDRVGNRCQPTLLTGVSEEMTVCRTETFGPVTSIYPIDSYAEGFARANDTDYGLSSAIFTRDIDKALHFARNIGAGMCQINGPTIHDEAHVPFGGNGESGVGREGTDADLEAMTELKWVTIQL